MSLTLLAPLGLAALAALALPLLIHLVRRLELKTTEFAALRWIGERLRPQRRLRFERPWLLLLRLLLLALLAVLLARPVWHGDAQPARPWVVVAPGVALADARAAVGATDAQWHWLAPQFPGVDDALPSTNVPVASLLRELDAQLPRTAPLIAVVPEQLGGLDGERLQLTRAIDWRIVPGRSPDAPAAADTDRIRLAVRYAPEAEPSLRYLRAAVAAWNHSEPSRYELDVQAGDAVPGDEVRWLIWLAAPSQALTQWLDRGGTAVVANRGEVDGTPFWRDADGRVLARNVASGRGRLIALTGAFDPAQLPLLLEADFPARLHSAFAGAAVPPARAPAASMHPRGEGAGSLTPLRSPASLRPLDSWLALVIAGLFLLERIVATWGAKTSDADDADTPVGADGREGRA